MRDDARMTPFGSAARKGKAVVTMPFRRARRRIANNRIARADDPYAVKENYITAHANVAWWEGHLNAQLVKEFASKLEGPLVDFGCNHGAVSILLAREGFDVTGVDRNADALAEARRMAASEAHDVQQRIRFVCSPLHSIECPDDAFAGGTMLDVIEHIYPDDRPGIFNEILRVLRPGARLLVVTPFEHAYDDDVSHVDFFTVESLAEVLEGLGMNVLEVARDQRPDRHTPTGHDRINALVERPR